MKEQVLDIHKEVLARVAEQYGLRFVVLHGSFARNAADETSDIDVAILPRKRLDSEQFFKLRSDLSEAFNLDGRDFDFKTLEMADPLFRYEVVSSGVLLFGDPTDFEEFKAAAFHMYEDARPLFALEQLLSKKLQHRLENLYFKHAQ